MTPARRELYVYYRVDESHWRDAAHAAAQWQQQLCAAYPGLQARLLRRPETADGVVTLMEVYALASGHGIDAALEAAIAHAGDALTAWRIGPRHCECFETIG